MEDKAESQGEFILHSITEAYDVRDVNCAKATLLALSGYFDFALEAQVLQAATAMNGAGRYRAQCGLVEGALMFMGIFFGSRGLSDDAVCDIAKKFAGQFEQQFGSLKCYDLRPGGFQPTDPKHKCKPLTLTSVNLVCDFIRQELNAGPGLTPIRVA